MISKRVENACLCWPLRSGLDQPALTDRLADSGETARSVIAASASLRNSGWSLARIYELWIVVALLSAVAAGAGYALLDGASPTTLAFILAFAGGAILTMLSTSMMPEAYEHAGRTVGLMTTLGFFVAFSIHWAQG